MRDTGISSASMDFFQHQADARQRTVRLIVYFVVAVLLIILAVYAAVSLTVFSAALRSAPLEEVPLWRVDIFLMVSSLTVILITAGSVYKIGTLSQGGKAVATMLGGRLLSPDSRKPDERKLLNVVEEMAIASGTPVPPVYLMPERSINAFAAGFTPSDAVIGVTEGCMGLLSREELQGVIAHEFSHILNGDMRLNLRLIGVLHGILLIGIVGGAMIRGAAGGSRMRTRRSKGGNGTAAVFFLGALLMAIGYIGLLCGKLIKSAVSRQREFLADASAVQFTRNPGGLAGALKKIGGLVSGSRIHSRHAETASHLFFGNALSGSLVNVMSTHPPLGERIQRIDPSFDGAFPRVEPAQTGEPALKDQYPGRSGLQQMDAGVPTRPAKVNASPAAAVQHIGAPDADDIAHAGDLREAIPERLQDAAHSSYSARAAVYALLMDPDPAKRKPQLDALRSAGDTSLFALTQKLLSDVDTLPSACRLPLIDMCLPALVDLSEDQYTAFRDQVGKLIIADAEISLFEFMLQRILFRHLDVATGRAPRRPTQYYSLNPLRTECAILLSTLAHVGATGPDEAQKAFSKAAGKLQLPSPKPTLLPQSETRIDLLDRALSRLAEVGAKQKRAVLDACTTCILADRTVKVREAELLRAVADSLSCPMPPLRPEQTA